MGVRPLGRPVIRSYSGTSNPPPDARPTLQSGVPPKPESGPEAARFFINQFHLLQSMRDTRTPEQRMIDHAFAEARREVESWWTGEVYQWEPFEG